MLSVLKISIFLHAINSRKWRKHSSSLQSHENWTGKANIWQSDIKKLTRWEGLAGSTLSENKDIFQRKLEKFLFSCLHCLIVCLHCCCLCFEHHLHVDLGITNLFWKVGLLLNIFTKICLSPACHWKTCFCFWNLWRSIRRHCSSGGIVLQEVDRKISISGNDLCRELNLWSIWSIWSIQRNQGIRRHCRSGIMLQEVDRKMENFNSRK